MSLSCFEVEGEKKSDGHRFVEVSDPSLFFSLFALRSLCRGSRVLDRCCCRLALAESKLTGTFFCVMTATESAPLTPMAVLPAAFAALKAYSVSLVCVVFYFFKDVACEPFVKSTVRRLL